MFIARRRFRPYQGSVPAVVRVLRGRFDFWGVPGSHLMLTRRPINARKQHGAAVANIAFVRRQLSVC